ncbi:MAG: hypothetical protein HN392_02900 [Anaerolineae bacterium]|jgi:hypothetical protein|nr:hypothetical protein [Anaerolineae bacterium]MBT7074871.1 hypothetical protein [Anaerolineae bacterium]MBT7781335.1 hypothetical protein [Anaerolineae bacterium]
MSAIRALELFDLPRLSRYRDEVIALDSRRALTRGNPLRARNFISYLNPKRRIYTGVFEDEKGVVLGGIIQRAEENFARLAYLAPARAPLALIDHLTAHAGVWQARQIVTEIDEKNALFQSLRQCGFSVYGHQRIWNLSDISHLDNALTRWRKKKDIDFPAIQNLENKIIPPLLLPLETFSNISSGMLCQNDELLAYIDISYGSRGIFLRPLIHPNTENLGEKLLNFLANLPKSHRLPIYLCVRSHQAWIEPVLEEMGARAGARQAVLVKYLVSRIRKEKTLPVAGEKAWANPAAPIQRLEMDE